MIFEKKRYGNQEKRAGKALFCLSPVPICFCPLAAFHQSFRLQAFFGEKAFNGKGHGKVQHENTDQLVGEDHGNILAHFHAG